MQLILVLFMITASYPDIKNPWRRVRTRGWSRRLILYQSSPANAPKMCSRLVNRLYMATYRVIVAIM